VSLGDDTGTVPASADPTNRGQVPLGAATDDDPAGHEHRTSGDATDGVEVVLAWLAEDPDPDTRAELQALLDAGDSAAIGERFSGRLEFGTAGLRGALGAGPMRMNRSVGAPRGRRSGRLPQGSRRPYRRDRVRRPHKSDVFAGRHRRPVVTGAGLRALVLPRPLPTPVLAFAIRHLDADAGVMVTASHNPPQDNGYKVYLGDGSQIVPPADVEISAAIEAVGPLAGVPLGDPGETLGDDVVDAYLDAAAAVAAARRPRDLTIVYTPLHGVGGESLVEALVRAGFPAPEVVPDQAEPDPDFPTVAFPNPEEPGAMDLSLSAGTAAHADIVIANDPDADRCAVGIPADGAWRMLRGDEVGVLLGAHVLDRHGPEAGTFAASIVSSSWLGRVVTARGGRYVETLTGFKWIARAEGLRFGYEEALGYCVDPASVRDKDGISAAVLVAELAAELKARGRTLQDRLDELAAAHGVHATDQLSVRVTDLSAIATAMQRLRAAPPASLGGRTVTSVDDLAAGVGDLPPTEGLRFWLERGGRVIVRPSGTEPKLKCYLEVVEPVDAGSDVAAARARATEGVARIKADMAAHVAM
jgi:phosphomannomutase